MQVFSRPRAIRALIGLVAVGTVVLATGCVRDLQVPGNNEALAVNARGVIVGDHFVKTPDGTIVTILPGSSALNAHDVVVGTEQVGCGSNCTFPVPFRRDLAVPAPTILGSLAGGSGVGGAEDVNDAGLIVGWAFDGASQLPAVWDGGATPVALPHPAGGFGRATAANARGDVVGQVAVAAGDRAVLWDAATRTYRELDTGVSMAADINDAGVVVGSVTIAGRTSPARWAPPDYAREVLPGGAFGGAALAINTAGTIVGEIYPVEVTTTPQAARWTAAGALGPLAPWDGASRANAINDGGTIVGYKFDEDGTRKAAVMFIPT